MTHSTPKELEEILAKAITDQIRGEKAEPVEEEPIEDFFEKVDDQKKATKQQAYSKIIGSPHPSGKEYYFTTHKVNDWDEDLRHLIPKIDDCHVFDHDYALSILMGIEFNAPSFAFGPAGSGKSVTPEQICARINRPFMMIAGMGGTEPSDFIGSPWVKDGSMEWQDGDLAFAVRRGIFLLYDEPFKNTAQTNMCLQSLLDDRRILKLYGHPDPIDRSLRAHKDFRIVLADNVRGDGDDMDKYCVEVQDQSTLNRMVYKTFVDYPSASIEEGILAKKFPEASPSLIKKVVQLANKLRDGWKQGELALPYSIRDTQNLLRASMFLKDVKAAYEKTYFGGINNEQEKTAAKDIYNFIGFGDTL